MIIIIETCAQVIRVQGGAQSQGDLGLVCEDILSIFVCKFFAIFVFKVRGVSIFLALSRTRLSVKRVYFFALEGFTRLKMKILANPSNTFIQRVL